MTTAEQQQLAISYAGQTMVFACSGLNTGTPLEVAIPSYDSNILVA